ncbi:hypothetical protein C8R47DRAFT_431662 [Mycena vitilis]|nr:hypothetical protein C8R47DRAFT_431662 [Mycena vitilis]
MFEHGESICVSSPLLPFRFRFRLLLISVLHPQACLPPCVHLLACSRARPGCSLAAPGAQTRWVSELRWWCSAARSTCRRRPRPRRHGLVSEVALEHWMEVGRALSAEDVTADPTSARSARFGGREKTPAARSLSRVQRPASLFSLSPLLLLHTHIRVLARPCQCPRASTPVSARGVPDTPGRVPLHGGFLFWGAASAGALRLPSLAGDGLAYLRSAGVRACSGAQLTR